MSRHVDRPGDLPTARLSTWRLLRGVLRLLGALWRNRSADGSRALGELRAVTARDLQTLPASLDDDALLARVDRLARSAFGAAHALEGVAAAQIGMIGANLLPRLTERWLGDRCLGHRLLQGSEGLDSAEAGRELRELGRLANALGIADQLEGSRDEVTARIGSSGEGARFLDAFVRFVERHGHHSRAESDVAVARWAEEPVYLLQQIRGAARGAEASASLEAKRALEREALFQDVRRRLGPVRRRILFAVLERTARGVAARENGRSEATRRLSLARQALLELDRRLVERGLLAPGDLFFLTLEEAGPALAGAPRRAQVAERRRAHAHHLAAQPPAVIVADGRELEPASEEAAAVGDRILRGIGASPGVVEGPARVILREDATAVVEPGEILIAPFTDPGWTPYLAAAAGVVMDFGGILSHGSVLAREYGIPAVVNVKAGTRTIQSGQRVRVDGGRGLVQVLEVVAISA